MPRLPPPPPPPRYRVPAVAGRGTVEQGSTFSALKQAYVAIFNPPQLPAKATAGTADGLSSYLEHSFEKQRRTGGRVLAFALLVGGGWATLIPLSGAVVVPGTVVVASAVKKIQHQTGGTVAAITVTDGMHVNEGDILVRLDDTQVRANYQAVSKQLEEVRARLTRLAAERDGRDDDSLPTRAATDQLGTGATVLTSETTLYRARSESRRSQRQLLRTRATELETQAGLIDKELEGVQKLWEQKLTPLQRVTQLQREQSDTRGKIAETQLQLIKLDQDFKADVMKDLREAQDKEGELIEKTVAAKDQVDHVDLRAPVTGVVHELAVHTVGGVVTPAQVVMVIVPEGDELAIEAHLPPDQIDQVHNGQDALVKFPAFNARTTPDITGVVTQLSADITRDQPNSAGYYTVRVTMPGEQLTKLDRPLVAGMPSELFIKTTSRTMLSYMFKPITEQLGRMFKER
ncbi:MAG: HlyD family type I secretion periplasmic adaptor subunit [Conexibacteraceae bacterium]|nr:HlyD family type I secretion periplasmic adaptor subunit [Conexibacteraceae bacterium]